MSFKNKLINVGRRNPSLATFGYTFLKKFWSLEAGFINYEYPDNKSLATVSYDKVLEYNKIRPYGPKKKICYAPFNNLHFQMNGDVSSCSFNYDFILGNVKKDSIKDIWFGEKAENFRKTLANYNFHKCSSCQNVFDAGNYSSFPPLKYDLYSSDNSHYPTQMSFEMSNLCNYECVMCNEDFSSLIRKNRAKLPPLKFAYPESFFEEIKEFIPHLRIATFIGGEPLLIKSYFRLWEMIVDLNKDCIIHIQTNGSYLPLRFLELIESGRFDIGISIDGATKETFEKIRINANFDDVIQNVKTLKTYADKGKVVLNINFCPLTLNWFEIPDMVSMASAWSIPLKIINVENPRNLSLHHRSASYLQKVKEVLEKADFSEIAHSESVVSKNNVKAFNDFVKQIGYLISNALQRELFFKDIMDDARENPNDKFSRLFRESKLFANFTSNQKEEILDTLVNYIELNGIDAKIALRTKLRIYHMLAFFDHTADGESSTNMERALTILRNAAQEFILLEQEELEIATI